MVVVGLLRRLDEADRRLGLYPRRADDQHVEKWRLVYVGVGLAYVVVGVILFLVGQSNWVKVLNLTMIFGFVLFGFVVLIVQFRRRRSH